MKIELDKKQIDEITQKTINLLEKEVARLNRKISKLEQQNLALKDEMDTTKEVREKIRSLSYDLVCALESASWVDGCDDW